MGLRLALPRQVHLGFVRRGIGAARDEDGRAFLLLGHGRAGLLGGQGLNDVCVLLH